MPGLGETSLGAPQCHSLQLRCYLHNDLCWHLPKTLLWLPQESTCPFGVGGLPRGKGMVELRGRDWQGLCPHLARKSAACGPYSHIVAS